MDTTEILQMHAGEDSDGEEGDRNSKFTNERMEAGMIAGVESKPEDSSSNKIDSEIGAGGAISVGRENEGQSKRSSSRERDSRGSSNLPNNYCRDYMFFKCRRKTCKYFHPVKGTKEYRDALATRRGLKESDRSRSPVSERNKRSRERSVDDKDSICRDFLRNNCFRGKDCRFTHPPEGDGDELVWPQLCLDYRSGDCKRTECRFLHYSVEDEDFYMQTGTVHNELWQHLAKIALLDDKILKKRPVCKNFLRFNDCTLKNCRHRHLNEDEYDDEMYCLMARMIYERCLRFRTGDVPPAPTKRREVPAPLSALNTPMQLNNYGNREFDNFPMSNPYRADSSNASLTMELENLNRENMDLRRMMTEDTARFKSDMEHMKRENSKLQEEINYLRSTPADGVQKQREIEDLTNKLKCANDWLTDIRNKANSARRECEDLKGNVKSLTNELSSVNESNSKMQKKMSEMDIKMKNSELTLKEASLAHEKQVYLEEKIKFFHDSLKRCEAEFIHTLDSTFSIKTPQVMSYFPTWIFFTNSLNEVYSHINNNSNQSKANDHSTAPQQSGSLFNAPSSFSSSSVGFNSNSSNYASNGAYSGYTTNSNVSGNNHSGYGSNNPNSNYGYATINSGYSSNSGQAQGYYGNQNLGGY